MEDLVKIILALLSGGLVTGLFAYLINSKKETRVDFDSLLQVLSKDNERLRQKEDKFNALVNQHTQEISSLRHKLILLESSHMDISLPMWLKDTNGVMLTCNKAFENTFLIPNGRNSADYIGKRDVDVWGKKIGGAFWKNDLKVLHSRKKLDVLENVQMGDEVLKYRVIKEVRFHGRTVIGISGIAIPPMVS